MVQVSVSINGRAYRMACEDGQEDHLLALARRFDDLINQLKGDFGEIGDQRLTVMAGIMAMDQLVEMDSKVASLSEEVAALRDARSAVQEKNVGDQDAIALRIDKAAEQIERLSKVLLET
ncbi:cell division protein ZapA [Cohaesibacter celericrescens]|jgi:cell division protein ZapA|uniref:Cell division protein ZapA n=1 Tax=Cohaesibacter celericrescens TaxID=2067669 RepID=A0A2N5XLB1_9HYPH|nr:cell division protein ZapA [Cohaesibacter celericrescens]PLW75228.1 cell division protein ZapA [Cohaesibacter celericrescens]